MDRILNRVSIGVRLASFSKASFGVDLTQPVIIRAADRCTFSSNSMLVEEAHCDHPAAAYSHLDLTYVRYKLLSWFGWHPHVLPARPRMMFIRCFIFAEIIFA